MSWLRKKFGFLGFLGFNASVATVVLVAVMLALRASPPDSTLLTLIMTKQYVPSRWNPSEPCAALNDWQPWTAADLTNRLSSGAFWRRSLARRGLTFDPASVIAVNVQSIPSAPSQVEICVSLASGDPSNDMESLEVIMRSLAMEFRNEDDQYLLDKRSDAKAELKATGGDDQHLQNTIDRLNTILREAYTGGEIRSPFLTCAFTESNLKKRVDLVTNELRSLMTRMRLQPWF